MTSPSRAPQPAALHRCPGGCGRITSRRACTRCWNRLPAHLRDAVDAHALDRTPAGRARYADAVRDARDWWLDNPAPHDPDAKIAGECEHCHEPLLWLTTDAGRRMPVNADPDPERGNVVRTGAVAGVLGPGAAAAARKAGTRLWLHHVVTCPYRDRWHAKPAPKRRAPRR